jgi:hypothetical protein
MAAMRRRPLVVFAALLVAGFAAAGLRAAFTATKTTPQTLQAVADFLPPVVSAAQVAGPGGAAGVVQPGAEYRVCAQVADQGNPPSGVKSVTADVSALAGRTASAPLSAGSCTIGSAAFNYGSTSLTAGASLAPGTASYTVAATDNLAQSASQSFTVTVQAPPSSGCHGTAITATNGGAAKKQIDSGDVVLFSFTAPIDKQSIIPGWTGNGAAPPVTMRIADDGDSDLITVEYHGTVTPLGTIDTDSDFVNGGTVTFSGTLTTTGDDVRMSVDYQTGGPGHTVMGSPSHMTWTPGSGLRDTSGGPCATTPVTQPKNTQNF